MQTRSTLALSILAILATAACVSAPKPVDDEPAPSPSDDAVVEPIEPTEPTEPVEPIEPTEPIASTEPVEPTEPTEPVEPTEPTDPTDPTEPTKPSKCDGVGTSTLPGACIKFAKRKGTWTRAEAAAGISIPYTVIVEAEIANVVPRTQTQGGCGQPDSTGLIVFERLSGRNQQYCECDFGLCAGHQSPGTVPAAETKAKFKWKGRNWNGPSDTGRRPGTPFPPGKYTLEVSALGTVDGKPFEVRNEFAVVLTE